MMNIASHNEIYTHAQYFCGSFFISYIASTIDLTYS